jgi:hypothetical protein
LRFAAKASILPAPDFGFTRYFRITKDRKMTLFRTPFRVLAVAAMMAATPLACAWAQLAEEAAARLQAYAADQGFTIEWDAIRTSGDDAVLVGVRVGDGEATTPIGDVGLDGISRDEKGYRIGTVTLASMRSTDAEEGVDLVLTDVALGNVLLPEEDRRDYYGGGIFYESAEIGSLELGIRGVEVLTMARMRGEATEPDGTTPMRFSGAAGHFALDLSLIEDASQLAMLEALDLRRMEGRFEVEGNWNPDDGRLVLSQYDMIVDKAGTLGFTLELGGATPDLIRSARDLAKTMGEDADDEDPAQGLTFHSAAISVDDDSLTGRVLAYVARNQGMKPADIANQAKAVLPFLLLQLNNPELTAQATQAVSAFLDDPKNLTVSARPAQPVPFAMLMATAMMAPADLTRSLGLTVSAND